MNAELKKVLQMLACTIPIMVLGFVLFLQSPMYKNEKERQYLEQNEQIISYLKSNYYNYVPNREFLMDEFDITDEEINHYENMKSIFGRLK